LRIVVMMYMTPADSLPVPTSGSPPARAALVASAAIALYLGILPAEVLGWASASIRSLF